MSEGARPKALGVYIFAGGFTLGVRKHFDVVAHWEDGPFGTATVRHNMPEIDIHTDPNNWPVEAPQYQGLDLLYGNPPCAPWSAAGHLPKQKLRLAANNVSQKYELDPRVECVRRQFALLERLQPKIWIWESVARAFSTGKPFVDTLTARALEQGYAVTHVLVNGLYAGACQQRRRFFFVAHKVELPFAHPGKDPMTIGQVWAPYDPEWLREEHPRSKAKMTGTIAEFCHEMLPGEGGHEAFYKWHERKGTQPVLNDKGNVTGRPNFLMHRLHRDKVCGTIVSGTCLIHPDENRFLTVRETQLLSSYPATYEFQGNDAYGQISKAVLPSVGDWLGGICAAGINANVPIAAADVRAVNYLKPAPIPTAV
jgi:site-specific DNA-cytosine methylase